MKHTFKLHSPDHNSSSPLKQIMETKFLFTRALRSKNKYNALVLQNLEFHEC